MTSLEGPLESPPAGVSSRAFDVVVCRAALERCLDPRLGMEQARRLLKPGGCLMVEIPNHAACSARRLGPAWHHCDAGNFVSFFTARSVSRLAVASGFVAVETLYSNYVTQFRNSRTLLERMLWDRLYANVDRKAWHPAAQVELGALAGTGNLDVSARRREVRGRRLDRQEARRLTAGDHRSQSEPRAQLICERACEPNLRRQSNNRRRIGPGTIRSLSLWERVGVRVLPQKPAIRRHALSTSRSRFRPIPRRSQVVFTPRSCQYSLPDRELDSRAFAPASHHGSPVQSTALAREFPSRGQQ